MSKLTMKEAAKAWGEGKEIEWMSRNDYRSNGSWKPVSSTGFCFNEYIEYRIKQQGITSLTYEQLHRIYYDNFGNGRTNEEFHNALKAVSDAAIKQYIEDTKNNT